MRSSAMFRTGAILLLIFTGHVDAQGVALNGTVDPLLFRPQTLEEAQQEMRESVYRAIRTRGDSAALSYVYDVRELAGDDGVLDPADMERHSQYLFSRARAGSLSEMLAWDLNGDAEITAAEASGTIPFVFMDGWSSTTGFGMDRFAAIDRDADQILTWEEMVAFADMDMPNFPQADPARYLIFDINADGSVTEDEVHQTIVAIEAEIEPAPEPRRSLVCNIPPVGGAEQFVVFASPRAAALSTTRLAPGSDETQTAIVAIEPGDTPLYLYLSSTRETIWEVTGATERLSHLVVQSLDWHSGVTGVPADRLTFTDGCPMPNSQGFLRGEAERSFGRAADVTIWRPQVGSVSLPSGVDLISQSTFAPGNSRDFLGIEIETSVRGAEVEEVADVTTAAGITFHYLRFLQAYPMGLRQIAPADVITQARAERYETLPGDAGLVELMLAGQIMMAPDWSFLVVAPFDHFPDLEHPARFVLCDGIPWPSGSSWPISVRLAGPEQCLQHN